MKYASLLAAAGIVLVADALVLFHVWKNRSGPIETDITLTESELPLFHGSNDEDSSMTLNLRWIDLAGWERPIPWLDRKTLQELGFDISVAPSEDKAVEFYQRQRARRAFVALEYDGPAWPRRVDAEENRERPELSPLSAPPYQQVLQTHLVAIDAGADAARLRGRHPDRSSVIIVPAVIRIMVMPNLANRGRPSSPDLSGSLQEIQTSIHVPRPFSDVFRHLPGNAAYKIHLRYGALFEPWIVGVEVPRPASR